MGTHAAQEMFPGGNDLQGHSPHRLVLSGAIAGRGSNSLMPLRRDATKYPLSSKEFGGMLSRAGTFKIQAQDVSQYSTLYQLEKNIIIIEFSVNRRRGAIDS